MLKKIILAVLVICLLILVPLWSKNLIGSKPTKEFKHPETSKVKTFLNEELEQSRKELAKNPEDLLALKKHAGLLAEEVQKNQNQTLVFELIGALSKILAAEPDNQQVILDLANISFERQVFDQAVELYKKYLSYVPNDIFVRGRYASALIFENKVDSAITQLDEVLDRDPKNFAAMAYKAIAFSQKGDKEKAIETGKQALALAPDEEGRKRFQKFLDSLTKQPSDKSLEGYLASHSIAGSKFVKLVRNDKTLELYFKDFPMDQMPDFAKEKFIKGIKEVEKDFEVIQFWDVSSAKMMYETKND